jgi:hypothetical protein
MRDMRVPIWRLISTSLSRPRAVEFTKTQLSTRHPPLANVNRVKWDQTMEKERRLVWRVRRYWRGITRGGRFPRRDEINPHMLGEDGANCLLIAVESPIELSHFVMVGVNLAVTLCPTDTLAGVLLSRLPQVVSAHRGLIIEGGAKFGGAEILYRAALLPLSEDGGTIDHVLGVASYRPLDVGESLTRQVLFRTHWL